jgi:hypothetical protein
MKMDHLSSTYLKASIKIRNILTAYSCQSERSPGFLKRDSMRPRHGGFTYPGSHDG